MFWFLGTETIPYDAEVRVCRSENPDQCNLCGYLRINERGSWGTLVCPEPGLDGSQVRITKPQEPNPDFLAICEIEIHGETIPS